MPNAPYSNRYARDLNNDQLKKIYDDQDEITTCSGAVFVQFFKPSGTAYPNYPKTTGSTD